jgi:hypothetical protein
MNLFGLQVYLNAFKILRTAFVVSVIFFLQGIISANYFCKLDPPSIML